MKQAEVAAYFQRFDKAEQMYLDMDRRWGGTSQILANLNQSKMYI